MCTLPGTCYPKAGDTRGWMWLRCMVSASCVFCHIPILSIRNCVLCAWSCASCRLLIVGKLSWRKYGLQDLGIGMCCKCNIPLSDGVVNVGVALGMVLLLALEPQPGMPFENPGAILASKGKAPAEVIFLAMEGANQQQQGEQQENGFGLCLPN